MICWLIYFACTHLGHRCCCRLIPLPPWLVYSITVANGDIVFNDWLPRRCRLVSSSIRLVGHTTVDGRLRLHCRFAFVAVNWCFRLYSWWTPPPLMGLVIYTTGLPSPPLPSVFIVIDGQLCSYISHLCRHQEEYYKAKSSFFLIWYFPYPLPHYINWFAVDLWVGGYRCYIIFFKQFS